jgi:uncharacterized protein YkwD
MAWKTWLSKTLLGVALFVLLISTVPISAQNYRLRKSSRPAVSSKLNYRGSLASNENEIHALVNRERSRGGLGGLEWDDRLAQLARAYSRQMARESFFSHFDGDGNSVMERAENSAITDWRKIGENLFFCEGYDEFDRLAVRGWMESPTHRQNILDRKFNATGIGIAQSRDGEIYITQVFVER